MRKAKRLQTRSVRGKVGSEWKKRPRPGGRFKWNNEIPIRGTGSFAQRRGSATRRAIRAPKPLPIPSCHAPPTEPSMPQQVER